MSEAVRVHLAELIEEEMKERSWDVNTLAFRSMNLHAKNVGAWPEEWQRELQVRHLAIEMFLTLREPEVVLGEMDQWFAQAFEINANFFSGFHEMWRDEALMMKREKAEAKS